MKKFCLFIFQKTKLFFLSFSVLLTLILSIGFSVSSFFSEEHEEINREKVQKYKVYQSMDLVANAASRMSFKLGRKPLKKIVLLFHSFSTSPEGYRELLSLLDARGIPYYAPTILGFGLEDTHLLEKVQAEDWIRDAVGHYNICSALADEVYVVGESMGALLALMVAKIKKTEKLFLLSPALAFKGEALDVQKKYYNNWFVRFYLDHIKRYLKLHPESRAIFRYESLPVQSLNALSVLQKMVLRDTSPLRDKAVHVFYGKQDEVADIDKMLNYLKKMKIPYDSHGYDTFHSLFIENGKDQKKIIQHIGRVLSEQD